MPALPRIRNLVLVGLVIGLSAGQAAAADLPRNAQLARHACLTEAEQRAAVAKRRVISLARAIKKARRHRKRRSAEVVRAQLCRRGARLIYILTLLAPNGRVTRVAVDATNGKLIKGHSKRH